MPLLPSMVSFPEAGEYIRYWDKIDREIKFLWLTERVAPLRYPRRLSRVNAGGLTTLAQLLEINPSKDKRHRYMAYIGVRPYGLYRVYHPFDTRYLLWDERITVIDPDLVGEITFKDSPYDAPTFSVWIRPDEFPAVEAFSTHSVSSVPEIIVVAARYTVEEKIDAKLLKQLQANEIPSIHVNFGGST